MATIGYTASNGDDCHKVAFNSFPPYSMQVSSDPVRWRGVLLQVLEIVALKLSICFKQYQSVDGAWGAPLPNGSWSGIIGMVHRQEVDFIGTVMGLSYERMQAVEFTQVFLVTNHAIVFKMPRVEADIIGFVKPYTLLVWVVIVAVCAILVAVWMIFFRVKASIVAMKEHHSGQAPSTPPSGQKMTELYQSLMLTFRVLMSQSLERNAEYRFDRYLLCVWMLCGMLIGVFYKSCLMAMLISPKISMPVNSIQDLVDKSNYNYVAFQGSYLYRVITSSTRETVYGRMNDKVVFDTRLMKAMEDVIDDKYFFIALESGFLGVFSMERFRDCPLSMNKEKFLPIHLALPVGRHWQYKEQLNQIMIGLTEGGIINFLDYTATLPGRRCLQQQGNAGSGLRALEVKDFYGIFLLYFAGVGLALTALLIELCFRPSRRATVAEEGGGDLAETGMKSKF